MKIISKRERGYRFYSEKYDLNGAYAGKKDVPIGVLILYVLVKKCDVSDHVQVEEESTAENDYAEEDSVPEDEELSVDDEQSDELFDDVGVHTYELIVSDVTLHDIWV